jgi:uncharacterized DUF497 family protein
MQEGIFMGCHEREPFGISAIPVRGMRFRFSKAKSDALRKNPKRGIGFEEAQEIFSHPYYQDQRCDDPEQYRVIGWVKGELYSIIFEVREDLVGEYCHFVTLWRATREEREIYEANQ